MAYTVKHLHDGASFERQHIQFNEKPKARSWKVHIDPAIEAFHKTLPHYGETKLHNLPSVASELGFSHVFIKDESTRFGLPSFKILGASWTIQQTICKRLDLPKTTSLDELKKALKDRKDLRLVTCTEGNWGRACARMAKYLGTPVTIYVPYFMNEYTQNLLRDEDADVKVVANGSYDDAIAAVREDVETTGAIMVLDTSWEGFTEIPQASKVAGALNSSLLTTHMQWVTDGYSTMLVETDRQVAAETDGKSANLAFVSVGVGSWAHAVVEHYKARGATNRIVTVEPEAAPSFKESLHCGEITPISTGETIMNGMNVS